MTTFTLSSVKDCEYICSNGKDVLLSGKNLWLFRADGTFVARYKTIRGIYTAAFLPGNTVLVQSMKGFYHHIALDDGQVLWSSEKKAKGVHAVQRFAISPDGTAVYNLHTVDFDRLYIDRIIPEKCIHEQFVVRTGYRVSYEIFCDSDGVLCALQSQVQSNKQTEEFIERIAERQSGILAFSIDSEGVQSSWKKKWTCESKPTKYLLGCDGSHVMYGDFSVLQLETMKEFYLLPEEERMKIPEGSISLHYNATRCLLTVHYLAKNLNIVVDCKNRRVVAKYEGDRTGFGTEGCVIGNEFWIGTSEGIIRKPFPCV